MYATTNSQSEVRELAAELYSDKYRYLLTIARRNAVNEADAEEALQEAFANFIRAFDPRSDAAPLAWLTTTLKRQCWRQRRAAHLDRQVGQEAEPGGAGPGAIIEAIPSGASGPEQLLGRVDEARTKLAALKPAERRTLGLIAAGYSYQEVGQITGFSYTKTNRCAAEGRAALRSS